MRCKAPDIDPRLRKLLCGFKRVNVLCLLGGGCELLKATDEEKLKLGGGLTEK